MIISQFSFLILPNIDKNLDITLKITGNHDFSLQLSGTTGCLGQALGRILLTPWDGLKEGPWNRRKQGASDDRIVSLDGFIVIITVLSCCNCLKNIWVQLTLIPKSLVNQGKNIAEKMYQLILAKSLLLEKCASKPDLV